jgi:hypothetical protein
VLGKDRLPIKALKIGLAVNNGNRLTINSKQVVKVFKLLKEFNKLLLTLHLMMIMVVE